MNSIYLGTVRIMTDPIFIPHLSDKRRHMAIVRSGKPFFHYSAMEKPRDERIYYAKQFKIYTLVFWGRDAETACCTLKRGDFLEVKGHFTCHGMITDRGKHKGQINLYVDECRLSNGREPVTYEFNYTKHMTVGKLGNARLWIRGRGFATS